MNFPKKKLIKNIVYYTNNQLDTRVMIGCQKQILKGIKEDYIVSVSLKPLNFGKNLVLDLQSGYLSMFKQILAGLEFSNAEIIFFCEHDVLYHPSHFDFTPEENDIYYYNVNVYKWKYPNDSFLKLDDIKQVSGLCAYRKLLINHYKRKIVQILKNQEEGFNYNIGFEPGCYVPPRKRNDFKTKIWNSACPNIDILHSNNLTSSQWIKGEFNSLKILKDIEKEKCWSKNLI